MAPPLKFPVAGQPPALQLPPDAREVGTANFFRGISVSGEQALAREVASVLARGSRRQSKTLLHMKRLRWIVLGRVRGVEDGGR
jgi:hypothetical protein